MVSLSKGISSRESLERNYSNNGEGRLTARGEIVERRSQIRFNLRAPVHFSWRDRDGALHHGEGFTRDICSRGVYVCAEWRPPADVDIHVDISLPSLRDANGTVLISGKAKIVRVEAPVPDENFGGFVVESRSFLLEMK